MTNEEIIQKAEKAAPSWTSVDERNTLVGLAKQVREGGLIVEIGGLYGGMTCVLGLSNPLANIVVIDEFSWHPINELKASAALLLSNCNGAGVNNVRVITGDSRVVGKAWSQAIDLLWIDGGHSYEFVKSDLDHFGPYAIRIALHDYGNPFWKTIKKAVDDFLAAHPEWRFDHNVETVAVLERVISHETQMSEM